MVKLLGSVVLSLTFSLLCLPTADAGSFIVECDSYTESYNTGGTPVGNISCSGALNGVATWGVDIVGEWIELSFNAPLTASYTVSLRSSSPQSQATTMKATLVGTEQSSSFFYVGLGAG